MKYMLLGAAFLAAIATTQTLTADIIYSDSFTRTTGSGDGNGDPNGASGNVSDWGTNDNALGGSNTQAWVAGPTRAGGGRNAVTDDVRGINHGTTSFYDFDVTGSAPNGFTVAMDFRRFLSDPTNPPGGYIAIGLGVDSGTAISNDFHAIGASDWSVLFQQAANGNVGNANAKTDNSGAGVNFNYGDPNAEHSLLLTAIPQAAGAYGAADLIDINVLIDGMISQDFTTVGGTDFGTLAISANNFEARYIDNLVVSAVPEPGIACVALLGFGLAFARRRRV